MRIKKADFIIFAIPLIIAAVSAFILFRPIGGASAEIIVDGETVRTIDLSTAKNEIIDLDLPYHNLIEVRDGKIGIISADCGDKICVNTGYISRAGQSAVCIPSKLVIKIGGGYDAVTG